MTLIESVIIHEETVTQTVDCMICGGPIVVNGDRSFSCQYCGSDYEVVTRIPLAIHYPAQDCGE